MKHQPRGRENIGYESNISAACFDPLRGRMRTGGVVFGAPSGIS